MKNEKAGRPLRPGEGFQGCVSVDGTFTRFRNIEHMHASHHYGRNLTCTEMQRRAHLRLPVHLAFWLTWYAVRIVSTGQMVVDSLSARRLAA